MQLVNRLPKEFLSIVLKSLIWNLKKTYYVL